MVPVDHGMFPTYSIHRNRGLVLAHCCLLMLGFLVHPAHGQNSNGPSNAADQKTVDDNLFNLILKVRKSNYDPSVGLAAISSLKEVFNQSSDSFTKENVANVLIRLGQKDEVYWSVLAKRALQIVDSNAPNPLVYDENGETVSGRVSPHFIDWAKAHDRVRR